MAEELNGEQVYEIVDYYGKKRKVPLGIKTPQIPRGVGISIDSRGDVQCEADEWQAKGKIQNLKNLLVQTYTSLAIDISLRNLGYNVSQQKQGDKVYIYAQV